MRLPPTAEESLACLEDKIFHESETVEDVHNTRHRPLIHHLLWLSRAGGYCHVQSDSLVQPFLARIQDRVRLRTQVREVARERERERRRQVAHTLHEIGERIFEEVDNAVAVYHPRYRTCVHHWILRGVGEFDEARSWELVDSFLDGIYARVREEEEETLRQQREQDEREAYAAWRASGAFTPLASTAPTESDPLESVDLGEEAPADAASHT
eukprot:GHVU01201062.1.p1 GENE.GHVU01201062.1~~GHVU01201062.1.p1  ORF type:complete len:212 (+),score=24.40 GHVU01201062.1:317-952(+)